MMKVLAMLAFTVIGMISQAYSAYIFASTWLLSDYKITKIGGTYFDQNAYFISFMQTTRQETYKGLFFLIIGLILILIPTIINSWLYKGY